MSQKEQAKHLHQKARLSFTTLKSFIDLDIWIPVCRGTASLYSQLSTVLNPEL